MLKLNTYSIKGVKKTPTSLPKTWQEKENLALLAQALRVYEARRHPGLSKIKTKGEVSVSTRKIYKQKGTGNARHGARSAPIFVGGGKAHGPKGVKRELSLSKKMRRKALLVALTIKAKDGLLVVVDDFSKLKKTKESATLIDKITKSEKGVGKKARFTFALLDKNNNAQLALRNIKNIETVPFRNLNAYNVFYGGVLIVDKEVLGEGSVGSTGRSGRTLRRQGYGGQASSAGKEKSKKGIKSTKSIKGKTVKTKTKSK